MLILAFQGLSMGFLDTGLYSLCSEVFNMLMQFYEYLLLIELVMQNFVQTNAHFVWNCHN